MTILTRQSQERIMEYLAGLKLRHNKKIRRKGGTILCFAGPRGLVKPHG